MWHLEPLYVKKLPDKQQEKRSIPERSMSQVRESHSVISDVNGDQKSYSQHREQGHYLINFDVTIYTFPLIFDYSINTVSYFSFQEWRAGI